MTKPSELADEITRGPELPKECSWAELEAALLVNRANHDLIGALRRQVEVMMGALENIEDYVLNVSYPSPSTVAEIARQALTGEAQ